jgi:uncharacterized protein (DUF1697 family)
MKPQTSTPAYSIAFLRAINVGGHTVKMDQLRALFEELGLAKVETFIASGNVIFESPADPAAQVEAMIEQHLKQALGYDVATFIRSAAELTALMHHQPFATHELEEERNTLYIAFLRAAPDNEAKQRLMALRNEIDDFQVHEREVYWLCRKRISESTVSGALLEKTIGMAATIRNTTTVNKLAARYGARR